MHISHLPFASPVKRLKVPLLWSQLPTLAQHLVLVARDLWDSGVGPPQWLEDGIMVESLQVGRKPESLSPEMNRKINWKQTSVLGEPMFFFFPPWECKVMLGYQQLDGLFVLKDHELTKGQEGWCDGWNLPQFAVFHLVHIFLCMSNSPWLLDYYGAPFIQESHPGRWFVTHLVGTMPNILWLVIGRNDWAKNHHLVCVNRINHRNI